MVHALHMKYITHKLKRHGASHIEQSKVLGARLRPIWVTTFYYIYIYICKDLVGVYILSTQKAVRVVNSSTKWWCPQVGIEKLNAFRLSMTYLPPYLSLSLSLSLIWSNLRFGWVRYLQHRAHICQTFFHL